MPICQQCGQELSEDEINIGIDICSDCVLENSTKSAIKFSIICCFITIATIMFGTSFFPLILNYSDLLTEENLLYFIYNLAISVITGSILVTFIIYSIYRRFQKKKINTNNLAILREI